MAFVVPPNLSVIVSIWMESVLYGINIVVYLLCLYALGFNRNKLGGNAGDKLLALLTTLLFFSATAHMSVNVRRLVEGYVDPPTKQAMTAYLLDITVKSSIAKQYTLVMVTEPLFRHSDYLEGPHGMGEELEDICHTGAASKVTGITTAVYESLVAPGQSIFLKKISSWASAQFSLSLVMNVSATILIASRIFYVTRELRQHNPGLMRTYWRIIVIIVESASLAAVMQILELAFYEAKFPVIYFIADSTVQIVAMAPLLIIVLVGLTRDRNNGSWGSSYTTSREVTDVKFNNDTVEVGVGLSGHRLSRKPTPAYNQTASGSSQSISTHSIAFAAVQAKDATSVGDSSPVSSEETQEIDRLTDDEGPDSEGVQYR
ncbi:hypothetical protein EUX98_g1431 [Antrodiella citrinella]|uniref:Uncharacterized protein n=1 Tax=Antrodiella citrinella TaxID=2447956 RepID=A0A4S4N1D5_9APHY|nr:hypothetical protein EUX98_g1431 [Antrodiella citrinella]